MITRPLNVVLLLGEAIDVDAVGSCIGFDLGQGGTYVLHELHVVAGTASDGDGLAGAILQPVDIVEAAGVFSYDLSTAVPFALALGEGLTPLGLASGAHVLTLARPDRPAFVSTPDGRVFLRLISTVGCVVTCWGIAERVAAVVPSEAVAAYDASTLTGEEL